MYIEYDKEVDAAYIWLVDNIEEHKKNSVQKYGQRNLMIKLGYL